MKKKLKKSICEEAHDIVNNRDEEKERRLLNVRPLEIMFPPKAKVN